MEYTKKEKSNIEKNIRYVYHIITEEDFFLGLWGMKAYIDGVDIGSIRAAVRNCIGKILQSDIGKTLRFRVSNREVFCQMKQQGE